MREIRVHPENGFTSAVSNVDGKELLYAYRKVTGYPLYVSLGADKSVVMQRWYVHLAEFATVAVAASLALLLLSWLALRRAQAEQGATARLRATLNNLRDETVRREAAEGRVRQAQRMEAVGQLTAGIAHDFNNLLTAVLGSLEMLQNCLPPEDKRAARLLGTAEQGALRGAALTQRLLAFGRGQALRPEPVDLLTLVGGMSDLLRNSFSSSVRIETRFPIALAPALADASQLEVALLNLAVNARDAMPAGGLLIISAREERANPGEDNELRPGDYVVLGVSDTGEGMDPATLARCMEPFFTTKGVGKGTGLGLSMVHGLAAQSRGRLVLRSRVGEGTTAELWLPRAEAAITELPTAGVADRYPRPLHRRTVLVVDDDPLVLASTACMLEDLGHTAVEASSGRQALEILRDAVRVDLVVTDHSTPYMTGLQLAAELRQLRPSLPVLLASGYADTIELSRSGVPLLAKPFGQPALAAAVEQCTAETRAARPGRVLVVDDDAMVRVVVAGYLEDRGYDIAEASDGLDALARLDAGEGADLLVTDFSMPGMNGLMLIGEARQRLPGLPALLLTGYADANILPRIEGALDGATALLRKPVSGDELAARAAALLDACVEVGPVTS